MRKKRKRVREISFRTTTFRFHRSYTSRWIPIRLAGLYLVLSPFQCRAGRALLIGAAKSMLERTTRGTDDRMCARFVASRKSFAREGQAKFETRSVRNCRLVQANYFPHDFLYDKQEFVTEECIYGTR